MDGAIHRRGGPAILEECRKIRATEWPEGLPTGRAVATTGGALPARWVIHTVGPGLRERRGSPALLASCHTESLRVADELGAADGRVPGDLHGRLRLSAGRGRARSRSRRFRRRTPRCSEVRFVLFGGDAYMAFEHALGA